MEGTITTPEGKISLNGPVETQPEGQQIPTEVQTEKQTETPTETPADDQPETPPENPEEGQEPEGQEAGDDDIQAQLEFFNEVNRVRGVEVQVDYGDVAPNSVEGIAIRERAIEQSAIQKFQEELAAADPRGAAYLLHRRQGGTDEEFFSRKTLVLPDYELFKDNVDLQRQVYKNDLVRKGLSSEKADALVELAVKGNNLLDEADAAYRAQSEEDAKELARLAKVAEDEAKQWRTQVDTMDSMLNETIRKKDLKVIIPDTEQKDFNQFVRSMVQHDGEAFYIAQKIDPGTLQQVIESLYVQFKKGDLGAIITRKANSLNVKRNQIQLAGTRKKSETPPPAPTNNKLTLGQFRFPGES